ncbi:hypothetical protein EV126DRAFT_342300 [Verticillium dahliae]|nr:hypothetical protein EV126DRAFT_342300 [Verticillium dahliae]
MAVMQRRISQLYSAVRKALQLEIENIEVENKSPGWPSQAATGRVNQSPTQRHATTAFRRATTMCRTTPQSSETHLPKFFDSDIEKKVLGGMASAFQDWFNDLDKTNGVECVCGGKDQEQQQFTHDYGPRLTVSVVSCRVPTGAKWLVFGPNTDNKEAKTSSAAFCGGPPEDAVLEQYLKEHLQPTTFAKFLGKCFYDDHIVQEILTTIFRKAGTDSLARDVLLLLVAHCLQSSMLFLKESSPSSEGTLSNGTPAKQVNMAVSKALRRLQLEKLTQVLERLPSTQDSSHALVGLLIFQGFMLYDTLYRQWKFVDNLHTKMFELEEMFAPHIRADAELTSMVTQHGESVVPFFMSYTAAISSSHTSLGGGGF